MGNFSFQDGYLSFDHIRYHIGPDSNNASRHVVEELGFG